MKEISFFIPFRNEALNLEKTINDIVFVSTSLLTNFEIILIDDHSTDDSFKIASQFSTEENIKIFSLQKNKGFGAAYHKGITECTLSFCMYLPADGDVSREELFYLLKTWDGSSILVQYCQNPHQRKYFRYLLSLFYTKIVSLASHLHLPYYNGFNILPKCNFNFPSNFGFSNQAFYLISSIKQSKKNIQTLSTLCRFNDAESKAITFKNIYQSFRFIIYILNEL